MKIACLQFTPFLGDVEKSIAKADAILSAASLAGIDLLVLPELAFTGYNFPSLSAILPHLEPTAAGPTTHWARRTAARLSCVVHAGYPETTGATHYNASVTVSPAGAVLAHYRKAFLYCADETWAAESDGGFFAAEIPGLSDLAGPGGARVGNVALGICMDINPYRFSTAWGAYEFARHVEASEAGLVVLSMAWLSTAAGAEGEVVEAAKRALEREPRVPEAPTLGYWAARFAPLLEARREVLLVMANRTGWEGDGVFAGSSAVMRVRGGRLQVWDVLGRGEEKCLVVDTEEKTKFTFVERTA